MVPDDLRSAKRLDALFGQAVSNGLVGESSAERLRFFAAAEHAQRVGRQNPCGLFIAVVRQGLWSYISQADEDRALMALKGCELRKGLAAVQAGNRQTRGRLHDTAASGAGGGSDFVTGLVRELARLRSFEGMRPRARVRPLCDEVRVAAA